MFSPRLGRSTPLLCAALVLASACSDRANPLNPTPAPPGGTPGTPVTVQALDCVASRTAATVSCKAARPQGGGSADITVGGQNVYVTVTTSAVNYNSGTGQFTFNTTVTNLIPQPMGTTDGTTLDPNGIRIFFHTGPSVTSGTGVASVIPDGFATFTAAGQPYYQYNQILANAATSAVKVWTLVMPPTVNTFDFTLYVSAPVEYPNGYISLDGQLPGYSFGSLHPGSSHPLTAVVRSALGNVIGGVVTFGTGDPNCATVDGGGNVTGVRYATCSITATSGLLGGSMSFDVTGTTRNWNGSASTDWANGANWDLGFTPATTDSVTIPSGVTNFPALTAPVTISNVTVADLATLSLGGFDLTTTGDVATGPTAGSGILSTTGTLQLTGTGKLIHGRASRFGITGTYSLNGDLYGVAPSEVTNGRLITENYMFQNTAQ